MIKFITRKLITVLVFLLSITIHGQIKNNVEKYGSNESSTIYRVEDEDKEMEDAIKLAQENFHEFENALKSNNPNFKNFLLKKGYESDQGDEFLWIKDIMIYEAKNKYVGIIAVQPLHTKIVKFDDIVEISKEEIADWMYLDNNTAKGAFTLKLLRSRMPDVQKQNFDMETNFIFK
ncbi:DUF2314 domain-containing protein [Flavobacterium sp. ALJ2]|uniref:DUF2314 domain-containing protein n=1 Tax=Flavobacterium sp. ALJ2 TaxID=2786960 RepID=UPI00189EF6A7|nr:DUF2314 domain-containing protein [Flavobacterium sp. ALJ2]MBF7093477.1 DUF2314 domain-containing protein [Flavobacterium sp. ALJ2]